MPGVQAANYDHVSADTRSDISPLCLSVERVAFASMVDQPRFPDDALS
jgi:hypothetical protein